MLLYGLIQGGDGAHIFCPASAALAIKSYNPDIIVHPILAVEEEDKSLEEVSRWYPRMHSLVIGPGMGREIDTMQLVKKLIKKAVALNKNIVIDADGLFLIQQDLELIRGKENIILTPNAVEFKRLVEAANKLEPVEETISEQLTLPQQTERLASKLGHITVVCKGNVDIISNGRKVVECTTEGSPRRVYGQGDILSGSMGLFLFWTTKAEKERSLPISAPMLAAYASCHMLKLCNALAFSRHRRSMLASDMLSVLPEVFSSTYDTPHNDKS
ncbi:ATP-dependent (S)-NAD(P)H-hydrate dehydratase-like isoform X2 [Dysidea avara]|uniref:ATP-dependent (S)-NAD(P)H-hydrate dehydratase-like isoform X2 n=1 Tax=Dysidea avara TaxID=196820 RepID=UPI00332DC552